MLEGKGVVRETDMAEEMQWRVLELAYLALDVHQVSDCQPISHYIKQKFDEAYGTVWLGRILGHASLTYVQLLSSSESRCWSFSSSRTAMTTASPKKKLLGQDSRAEPQKDKFAADDEDDSFSITGTLNSVEN